MILGITGGIGTGKTTAEGVLARFGARVIDGDLISHYLTGYDPAVLKAVRAAFGDAVFFKHGALNRQLLADLVFGDHAKRKALEAILHPPILTVVAANIALAKERHEPLVVTAPLMFESGLSRSMDRVWVISCSEENQLKRLLARSNMNAEEVAKRIAAQMSLKEKELLADLVIYNDGTLDELATKLTHAWEALLAEDQ